MGKKYSALNEAEKSTARIAKQNWRQLNKVTQAQLNIWIPQVIMKNLKLDAANRQIKVAELVRDILNSLGYGEEKDWDAVFAKAGIQTAFNNQEALDAFPDDFLDQMSAFNE